MITPSFIGIAGGTASGKSTIAKKLYNYYGSSNAIIIDQDSYYKDNNLSLSNREIINYDHPDSIDIELFYSNLIELKNNNSIMKPVYNFSTHARNPEFKAIKPKKTLRNSKPIISVKACPSLFHLSVPEEIFPSP